jgi:protein-S-isoprenylcysteine O-methyltransferase Ste14
MNHIAAALGHMPGLRFTIRTVVLFGVCVCGLNALQMVCLLAFGGVYPVLHAFGWASWFVWQGVVFPNARARALAIHGSRAYAAVFYKQILPGVCWGVSNMTLPVMMFKPSAIHGSLRLGVGVLVLAAGASLLVSGFRTIGMARAGFLTEYMSPGMPMSRQGIYSLIRHPLFVGGALMSLGGTLAAAPAAIAIACVNVAILPFYTTVEDYRLQRVFGAEYRHYARSVGGILPHLGRLAAALSSRTTPPLASGW